MTIPASQIANVIPGVLSPGGSGLVMNGLVLTENVLLPAGTVQSFASAEAVSAFFGPSSAEFAYASIYFAGYVNGTQLPSSILFASYNGTAARAATLTTGSFAHYSLAEMQAISGVLTLTVNGTAITSASISLTGVVSQSAMATAIQAAFTDPNFAVSWSSVTSQFVFTSNTTGTNSTITFGTGTIADDLLTTAAAGAVLSQGAAVDTPSVAMTRIWGLNQNWATMSSMFEPDLADKKLFAAWFSEQDDEVLWGAWDSDSNASVSGGAGTFGVWAVANNINGVMCIGGDPALGTLGPLVMNVAAFVQGMIASINFSQTNGRITLAGKSAQASAAVLPTCANIQTYQNLLANGYNCYGAFASRNQGFTFFSNGNMPGSFPWADQYIDQIWLSAQLQLALLNLYTAVNDIPYDPTGYGLIRAALVGQPTANGNVTFDGPINNALNNGVIQIGVTLSSTQAAAVNNAAGANVAGTIQSNGYYLQILDPGAAARNARQTPIINLWYTDGGAVQQFSMASVDIL
jgi:hypothetical protein